LVFGFWFLVFGCIENKLQSNDETDSTIIIEGPETPGAVLDKIIRMDNCTCVTGVTGGDWSGWSDGCYFMTEPYSGSFQSGDANYIGAVSANISSYKIEGLTNPQASGGTSVFPGSIPMRMAATDLLSGYYPPAPFYGDDITAEVGGVEGDWEALAESSELNNLDQIQSMDEVWYSIEMDLDNIDPAGIGDECEDYLDMELTVVYNQTNSKRTVPVNSTCAPGTGSFQLIPWRIRNRDKDGDMAVVFKAIQKSGSGVMTNAAWINNITISQSDGQDLRVVKVNKTYSFDEFDDLVASTLVAKDLNQTTTNFPNGVISGNAPFIVLDAPEGVSADFSVDMEWSCATPTQFEELSPPIGYTFSLDSLSCLNGWTQKFTVRPMPALSPDRLVLQTYGSLHDPLSFPLTSTISGTKEFRFEQGDLVVEGELGSHSATTGATIDINEISWAGQSICTAGTYVFPAED